MLNTDCEQTIGLKFADHALDIQRPHAHLRRALDTIKNARHGQTAFVVHTALFAGPEDFRVDKHLQLIACFGNIEHDNLLMHINLRCGQANAWCFVHGFCHVGDQLPEAIIKYRHRFGDLVQATIWVTEDCS